MKKSVIKTLIYRRYPDRPNPKPLLLPYTSPLQRVCNASVHALLHVHYISYREQLRIEPEAERTMSGVYRPQKRTGCRSARRFSPRRSPPRAAHRGCRLRTPPGPPRGCPAARSATFQTPRPKTPAPPCWLGSCDCLLRCPRRSPVHKQTARIRLLHDFLFKRFLVLFYSLSHIGRIYIYIYS